MWVSRKEFKALSDRVSELESAVRTIQIRTHDYPIYPSPFSAYYTTPLARIPLWDMIHRIREHLGLDIKTRPQSWELVKSEPSKKAK